jgi:E3 ubiquitin-protein ligase RNF14
VNAGTYAMDGEGDSADDERAIELSTITAIYPELEVDAQNPFAASLEIDVNPTNLFPVVFPPLSSTAPPSLVFTLGKSDETNPEASLVNEQPAVEIRHLSYLPPLLLTIDLPQGYPEKKPPVLKVKSQADWLPQNIIQELEKDGLSMWESYGRNQMIFDYIDHLKDRAAECFGLITKGGPAFELPHDLEIALLDYDLKTKRKIFERETFDCGVCLEPKKGAACHRLQLCGHVFCVECLQDFYNNCIKEGDVTNVKCLAPDCEKNARLDPNASHTPQRLKRKRKVDRSLDPSELLQIPLDQDVVQRYIKLKRKNLLESNKRTVYCPRQWCQGAARTKSNPIPGEEAEDSDDENDGGPRNYDPNEGEDKLPPPSERLAVCEDCAFAFCSVCKTGWHGEFQRCFPRRQYELTAEEKASEEYMRKHSTACPTCDARCQKTMGCNHSEYFLLKLGSDGLLILYSDLLQV